MQHKKIPLADTKAFSPFFLDYIHKKETLKPFYNRFPLPENFKDQIKEKAASYTSLQRSTLVTTVQKQYKAIKVSESVSRNIADLEDSKTFTVRLLHK